MAIFLSDSQSSLIRPAGRLEKVLVVHTAAKSSLRLKIQLWMCSLLL